MPVWFYVIGEDRKGPIEQSEIRQLIDQGHVTPQTYVWRNGMQGWQAAGEHPDLSDAFVVPPPVPTPPKMPPAAFQPVGGAPVVNKTSRPWPRFWARFIDNLILIPLCGLAIGLWSTIYAPDIYVAIVGMNPILFNLMIFPLVALQLALSMALTGSTLGKAIVGVHVPVPVGENRFGFFLVREFNVWISGLGLGIPFVALFTQVAQYRRLASGRAASYDEGNPEVVANPSKGRLAIAILAVAVLFTGNIILRTEDERSTTSLTRTQTWVSPITGKSATIGATWQTQPIDTNSGSVFYFVSDELLSEAIFGHETLPSGNVEAAAYADAIKNVLTSEINIETEWQPVEVGGMPALQATGRSTKATDAIVEVTVAVRGSDAWRTLVYTRGTSASQMAEKQRFVSAMLGTAN